MGFRNDAEESTVESSHVDAGQPVIDDQPVIVAAGRGGVAEDPTRGIRNVLRRWRLITLVVLVGAALGVASAALSSTTDVAPVQVDHYQASHVLVLDGNVPANQTVLSVRNLNTVAKRITIGDLPEAVSEQSSLTPSEVATQVRVIIRSDSESIDIKTIGRTPAVAEELADLYAAELFAHLHAEAEGFARESIAAAQGRLDEAELNLTAVRTEIRAAEASEDERLVALLQQDEQQFLAARIHANAALLDAKADGVPLVPLETLQRAEGTASVISQPRFEELVDMATLGQNIEILFGDEVESGPSGGALAAVSSKLPDGVFPRLVGGTIAGLLAGLTLVLFLNRLDNRIRSKRQIEELIDLPVLAEVPALARADRRRTHLVSRERPRSRFAEQHRALASTVLYATRVRRRRGQVVLVTSPGPAEGKTTTVANLGTMLAEAGEKVLLINADFRRPRLHAHLGVEDDPRSVIQTDIAGIDLVSNVVGDKDAAPIEVVSSQRRVIEKAKGHYDLIVIDTAPLLATNDAVDLLDLVDDVLLVVRAGRTTAQAADRAAEMLERRRAHVLGVALTEVDSKTAEDYYYYGSYYDDRAPAPQGRSGRRWIPWTGRSDDGTIDLDEESDEAGAEVVDLETEPITDEPTAVATVATDGGSASRWQSTTIERVEHRIVGTVSGLRSEHPPEFQTLGEFATSLTNPAPDDRVHIDSDSISIDETFGDDIVVELDDGLPVDQPPTTIRKPRRLRRLFGGGPLHHDDSGATDS